MILNADQRGYIQYNAQTITILLNTIISFILISSGFSVQLVKLSTSCIFLLRPLILSTYVKQSYKINWRIQYSREPIQQKWNGVAQHIAAIILDTTDIIVLTIFSITNGIQSLIGELWAKKELNELSEVFSWTEWCIHTGTTFIFSCTAVLIVPFVQVYTAGIHDADYSQPLFALLLVGANAMHCLRLPYNIMVLAAGHYKQTQQNYINAALLNITISVLAVKNWGLIGVAIGTLVAMSYQTLWLSWYDSNHFIRYPMKLVLKQFLVDGGTAVSTITVCHFLGINELSYFSWVLMAIKVTVITGAIVFVMNMLFYREKMMSFTKKVIRR